MGCRPRRRNSVLSGACICPGGVCRICRCSPAYHGRIRAWGNMICTAPLRRRRTLCICLVWQVFVSHFRLPPEVPRQTPPTASAGSQDHAGTARYRTTPGLSAVLCSPSSRGVAFVPVANGKAAHVSAAIRPLPHACPEPDYIVHAYLRHICSCASRDALPYVVSFVWHILHPPGFPARIFHKPRRMRQLKPVV